jgi:predicted RND superfamily exporter protein
VAESWRGAGELLGAAGVGAIRAVLARPGRVLAVGTVLAVLGWGLGTQVGVVSDIQRLVPANLPALRDLEALQNATGDSGEIDVSIQSDHLTDPRVIQWMTSYEGGLLSHYGYNPQKGCAQAVLCPALSLPDLFRAAGSATSPQQVAALLDAVPPYFSQAVVSSDHRAAALAFGIRLMPLDRQQRVIDDMRRRLHPPPGVQASLVGLPVLAAQANADVSSQWRRLLTLVVGLLAVAAVLLLVFRRRDRALVPLLPIALATGWASLVVFLTGVELNPMSVTLSALVVAIATEFSVLLSERYRQELADGHHPQDALWRMYRSTGGAVLASGVTAIAGFAVLMLSDIRMLRDFGVVTVVDLAVALVGVLLVLPAVLILAERGELAAMPARVRRAARRGLPRPRRPARAAR